MEKKKKYVKPKVICIPTDIKQMVKNSTGCSGSCPNVFVWDKREYIRENNILPDSEDLFRKEKVVEDYYVLQSQPEEENGCINLKIRELYREVSYLYNFHLMTVEHPKDYKIGFTTDNNLLSYKNPISALSCKNQYGEDCLLEVTNRDWINPERYFHASPGDSLEIDFGKVVSSSLKLVIVDPKDDERFLMAGCGGEPPAQRKSIHIYIYINQLPKIDTIHTRLDFYPDIVDLTPYISQIKDNLKIKLEFTAHHKVAFVGIDTTPPVPMKKRVYKLAQAIHSELGDVTETLKEENNQFVRLMPGEEIELKFPVPEPPKPGNKLSYVLVSKGYYIPVTKLISLRQKEQVC